MLTALITSLALVCLAEMGDKTQLLTLMLSVRYGRPLPLIAGIFLATLLNHAGTGAVGYWLRASLNPEWMRWGLAVSFFAVAVWILIPDTADEDTLTDDAGTANILWVTTWLFFMAEMGDKTQVATLAMAARFHDVVAVVVGSTLGMLAANVPVVYLGNAMASRLPLNAIRMVTALILAMMGMATLLWPGV
ncbi:MAG: TMEM165/GDT1 family protein [Candidatus Melainabacteria bacterium]